MARAKRQEAKPVELQVMRPADWKPSKALVRSLAQLLLAMVDQRAKAGGGK